MVLGLTGTFIVVRQLGSHDYGILAVVRTALAYVGIVIGAGLGQGLLRYLPAWRVTADRRRIRRALIAAFGLQVIVWTLLTLAIMIARPLVEGWVGGAVAGLLVLGVVLLLPEVLGHTATQIANANYDTRTLSVGVVVSTVAYVVSVAVLLQLGHGVAGVLVAGALSNVVLAAVLFARFGAYLGQAVHTGPGAEPAPDVWTAVRYSVPFVAIGILNLITWRQSEVLFLGHFHGASAAGLFDLAYRLPQTVLEFIPGAIWPLVMAGSTEIFVRDPGALRRTSGAYYRLLFLLVAPLGIGGFLVGDIMIRLIGGPEFAAAGVFCQIFFLVMSASFLTTPLSMALYVVERPWMGFGIYVLNSVINVGLDFLLIPRYGLWGAVIPVSVVIVISPFVTAAVLRRVDIVIRPPWGFLLRVYGASAAMLLLWPLRSLLAGPEGFLTLVAAGAGVFLTGVRVFGVFGPDERDLVERASPAVWKVMRPLVGRRGRRGGLP
jgi:O-antigen/teichoic acid export membrane protein